VDNYLPPLRSSRRRTHAPSDLQRNRSRKGQKKSEKRPARRKTAVVAIRRG